MLALAVARVAGAMRTAAGGGHTRTIRGARSGVCLMKGTLAIDTSPNEAATRTAAARRCMPPRVDRAGGYLKSLLPPAGRLPAARTRADLQSARVNGAPWQSSSPRSQPGEFAKLRVTSAVWPRASPRRRQQPTRRTARVLATGRRRRQQCRASQASSRPQQVRARGWSRPPEGRRGGPATTKRTSPDRQRA